VAYPLSWPASSGPYSPRRYTAHQVRRAVEATDPNYRPLLTPEQTRLMADPASLFRAAGMTPDPWQARFLADQSPRQTLLCCRRSGKTTAAGARTLAHCLTRPKALAMVFSPTRRQSQEFVRAVLDFDAAIGRPVRRVRDNLSEVEWANGARLLSLPDAQRGVVGFTPSLIVIDEASRVSDQLYKAVRPMLALGAGLVTLSTPFGKRGWFFDTWSDPQRLARFRWWRVTAAMCPRITREFLAEERLELGERWFRQEWYCSFEDAVDAVFSADIIAAARDEQVRPLFDLGV
jgi:hypothetical protein